MYWMGLWLQGKRDEERKKKKKRETETTSTTAVSPLNTQSQHAFPSPPRGTQGDCVHKIPFRPVPGMEFGRRANGHPVNEGNGGGEGITAYKGLRSILTETRKHQSTAQGTFSDA